MADDPRLAVELHGRRIGNLTLFPGERTVFAFDPEYIDDPDRATLGLAFQDGAGRLVTDIRPTRVRLPPFFSNLLPEGPMRDFLARRAGVHPRREFALLRILGRDLPGALRVVAPDADVPLSGPEAGPARATEPGAHGPLRFSLAGVQPKFSASIATANRLTIPAEGIGGSWIVKLPSAVHAGLPENEFSMMRLAALVGIAVPEVRLVGPQAIDGLPAGVPFDAGQALAVRRFDRGPDGPVHIEDFAQVFGLFPEQKYERASYRNIAEVIRAETDQASQDEFIRRLVFNTLIGNGDMHLKNWSLIYPDRRRPRLAPAYDLVSTIVYLPGDDSALRFGRTRRMEQFSADELSYLAAKSGLPERPTLRIARDTVDRTREAWTREAPHLPIPRAAVAAIDAHMARVPIASG
ncbi:kinase [Allostella vacuolata]|nr:kinase [Stella vacuolata]